MVQIGTGQTHSAFFVPQGYPRVVSKLLPAFIALRFPFSSWFLYDPVGLRNVGMMDTLAKRTVSLQAETHPVLASSRGRNRSKNKNDNMFGLTPNSPWTRRKRTQGSMAVCVWGSARWQAVRSVPGYGDYRAEPIQHGLPLQRPWGTGTACHD